MTSTYILDASSYQGVVDWAHVDQTIRGGFEKVTEGVRYVNSYWATAKPAMRARAAADGFIPGGYLFLDATATGADQADWFAQHAGDMTGFALAVDFERAPDGPPVVAQAQQAIAQLRRHYPGHPVGLYAPHWFTSGQDLRWGDWLWASSYVPGTGAPAVLYQSVPELFWAPYGGRSPDVLQFTSSALVPGVAGTCDCSVYRGDLTRVRELLLGAPPRPPVPSNTQESDMADSITISLVPGAPVTVPVWAGAPKDEPAAFKYAALQLAATAAAEVTVTFNGDGHVDRQTITVPAAAAVAVLPGKPLTWSQVATVSLATPSASSAKAGTGQVPAVTAVLTRW